MRQADPKPKQQAEVPVVRLKAEVPDLETQLESLLDEVWRQERFEREHPFYCATLRSLTQKLRGD